MANRYANLPGTSKIKDTYDRINQGFDKVEQDVDQLRADLDQEIADREAAVEYVDQRVDNIIVGGGPDKDPELVDIRTPDPSYTPLEPISTAGGMTRDMQRQISQGIGVMAKYIFGSNSRGATGWTSGVDNIGKSGIYYITQNRDGLPVSADGYLLHMTNTYVPEVTGAMQLFVPYGQNRVFFRRRDAQQWLAWIELQNNLSYETGVWTPTLAGMATAGSHTYHVQYGYYTRIGNLVTVQFRLHLTAKDPAMAGSVVIRGLPFTSITMGSYSGGGAINLIDRVELSAGYSQIVFSMPASSSQIALNQIGNNIAAIGLPPSAIKDNSIISGTLTYHIQG